jgi:hypothetical protein
MKAVRADQGHILSWHTTSVRVINFDVFPTLHSAILQCVAMFDLDSFVPVYFFFNSVFRFRTICSDVSIFSHLPKINQIKSAHGVCHSLDFDRGQPRSFLRRSNLNQQLLSNSH